MTTDLNHNLHDAPRRRFGAALFCLLCLGIAAFATFTDGKPVFGLIFGGLSFLGLIYFLAKIHAPSTWRASSDGFRPSGDDELTNPAYSVLSSNIYHEPEPFRIRDD